MARAFFNISIKSVLKGVSLFGKLYLRPGHKPNGTTQLGGIEYNGRSSKSKAKKSFPFSKTAIKYTILFMRRRSS